MKKIPELPEAPVSGQMSVFERQKLFEWVYTSEPSVAIEIGGGSDGGGSTFCIVEALRQLKLEGKCMNSMFYTCDIFNQRAKEFYLSQQCYKDFIRFYTGASESFINSLLEQNITPDFIFFDGPEDPNINLDDFLRLDNVVTSGCKFAMHDWEFTKRIFDGAVSIKAKELRPHIENLDTWVIEEQLSGLANEWPNKQEIQSVGLVYDRKL